MDNTFRIPTGVFAFTTLAALVGWGLDGAAPIYLTMSACMAWALAATLVRGTVGRNPTRDLTQSERHLTMGLTVFALLVSAGIAIDLWVW
ncbi:MAG: hypothetical protein AAGF71_06755 [Pseudomonadota bacterium]